MTEDIIEHTLMQDVILFISEWVAGYLEQMKPTFRPTLSFSLSWWSQTEGEIESNDSNVHLGEGFCSLFHLKDSTASVNVHIGCIRALPHQPIISGLLARRHTQTRCFRRALKMAALMMGHGLRKHCHLAFFALPCL